MRRLISDGAAGGAELWDAMRALLRTPEGHVSLVQALGIGADPAELGIAWMILLPMLAIGAPLAGLVLWRLWARARRRRAVEDARRAAEEAARAEREEAQQAALVARRRRTNRRLSAREEAEARRVAEAKGAPLETLRASLIAMGEDQREGLSPSELEARLEARAEDYAALAKRAAAPSTIDDPEVAALRQRAKPPSTSAGWRRPARSSPKSGNVRPCPYESGPTKRRS
ncbi:MAG: hypothetical protein AAF909_06055 [Pseudomonadota bacterium]